MEQEYYTSKEIMALLKISRSTLGRFLQSGELESVKVGREYRISASQLSAYLHRGGHSGQDH